MFRAHTATPVERLIQVCDLGQHLERKVAQHPHVAATIFQNLLRLFVPVRESLVDSSDHRFLGFAGSRVENSVVMASVDQASADVLAACGEFVVCQVAALNPQIKRCDAEDTIPSPRQS